MPMQAESLEVLEKADVPPAQARAIVRAIEIELIGAKDALATKHDLLLLRQEIHNDMAALQATLRSEMSELGKQLRSDVSELRGGMPNLSAEMSKLRMSDLRAEKSGVHGNMSRRREMSDLRRELTAEIRASASGVIRRMYTALVGQTALLLGLAYYFVTQIR